MMNEEVDGRYKYDVFLSFRGEDTYCTLASNLNHALCIKRINTFFPNQIPNDYDKLQLPPSILKAIHQSRISIVVLSENYVTSPCCLNELEIILHCMKMKNQLVLPIFYEIHASDIRLQKGRYGGLSQAMRKFEQRFKDYPHRKIHQWKQALSELTSIAGWTYGIDRFEYVLIKKIVEATLRWLPRFNVFLSFCGEDTRYSFTGFLYQALRREGFKIFMDDEGLECGNQISQTLVIEVEISRLSIVVLSKNYGYFTWCLDELVKIMECKKAKNQLVWPIFYKIEQSDVMNQTKSYGEAMKAHENRFGKDCENVQKWRSALSEVALLKGDHIKENEYEYEFIKKIVERAIETGSLM